MKNEKTSILITGAAGTVGIELINQLTDNESFKIYALDVLNAKTKKIFHPFLNKIDIIYGDLTHPEDLKKIPEKTDVVIHLAAIIPPLADKCPQLAESVNFGGTCNLIDHLEKTSPDCFFLFSSSIAVYGDRILSPEIRVGDSMIYSEGDVYAQTKIRCEDRIRKSALSWSIFRLTAIMKNHKISPIMFHMPLDTIMEISTPRDVAKAFINAVYHQKELEFNTYNLSGGRECRISFRDFIDRSFRLYGLGRLNFPVHAFAEKNFHCGMLMDGDILDNMLKFRTDTIDTYFEEVKQTIPWWLYLTGIIFRIPVKWYLLSKSEPYKAYQTKNISEMNHFFISKKIPITQS